MAVTRTRGLCCIRHFGPRVRSKYLMVLLVVTTLLFIILQLKSPALDDLQWTGESRLRFLFPALSNRNTTRALTRQRCHMENCFDFSRCSLSSSFRVFVHPFEKSSALTDLVLNPTVGDLSPNKYVTHDPNSACVFLVLLGGPKASSVTRDAFKQFLNSLPHWNGDGRNHVLINTHTWDNFADVDIGSALVAGSAFQSSQFREHFDVIIPPSTRTGSGDTWSEVAPVSPARRKYLVSFWGEYILPPQSDTQSDHEDDSGRAKAIATALQKVQAKAADVGELINLELSCKTSSPFGLASEWGLCEDSKQRSEILTQSTFTLLVSPMNDSLVSTISFQTRLSEALQHGAVPVILGSMHRRLPFGEILDWDETVLSLALPRASELLFYLNSFGDNDIANLRLRGRHLWESYFSSMQRVVDTTLAVLRTRLRIPALPVREEPAVTLFKTPPGKDVSLSVAAVSLFPSEKFQRNFSRSLIRKSFNMPGDPSSLFPYTPYEPLLPSEASFWGSAYGLHPAGKQNPGPNEMFNATLAGNFPQEQFTVVMLTYKRVTSMLAAINRLKGLPFLNKVLVVWNDPTPPSSTIAWPDIGVPLQVLKVKKNSLNNRYLPFESIETEAVLNIDDDVVLTHERILFGFRLWREFRDRIVGFFARYHNWDSSAHRWLYTTGTYPGQLSIIMQAFYHKYYLYLYSYVMPQAIRDHVEKNFNCEDIAINFLVAHVSRKPNIKVKNEWKMSCPGCGSGLANRGGHLDKRHQCMQLFVKVYGYMPLLFTSFTADSHPTYT